MNKKSLEFVTIRKALIALKNKCKIYATESEIKYELEDCLPNAYCPILDSKVKLENNVFTVKLDTFYNGEIVIEIPLQPFIRYDIIDYKIR